jgi:hypothetical protein
LRALPKWKTENREKETMTLEAIKEAIAGLPEEERSSLFAWVAEQSYDEWDKEMARDFSPGGRGYHLVDELKREFAEGQMRPMEEGFTERGKPLA